MEMAGVVKEVVGWEASVVSQAAASWVGVVEKVAVEAVEVGVGRVVLEGKEEGEGLRMEGEVEVDSTQEG